MLIKIRVKALFWRFGHKKTPVTHEIYHFGRIEIC
jgi:hypothetical protein